MKPRGLYDLQRRQGMGRRGDKFALMYFQVILESQEMARDAAEEMHYPAQWKPQKGTVHSAQPSAKVKDVNKTCSDSGTFCME